MAVVLDTATLPASERAAAFEATLNTATLPVRIERLSSSDDDVYARVQYWQLGAGIDQIYTETSGFRFSRTSRHVRIAAPERVSLAIHLEGPYVLRQGDTSWTQPGAQLRLVDLTAPYSYQTAGDPVAQSVSIDYDRLGLPVDLVRTAAPRLAESPLYDLARTFFRQLPTAASRVHDPSAAAMLGTSATELTRALITSAAGEERYLRSAMADSVLMRIDAHIARHLRDPDLSPASIAAAHNISVRYLHRLFEQRQLTVGRWVMEQRLEGARHELAHSAARTTVARTAHRWGFTNAGHFARRFRTAYGVTPQEWQRFHRR